MAKCLLELEEEYARPSRPIDDQASSDAFASLQWSVVSVYGSPNPQPALHTALIHCTKDELRSLLATARPHDVQVKSLSGCNTLHTATTTGRTESLAVLVILGVDMNAKNNYECPPAWYARRRDVPAKLHKNEIFDFFHAKGALLVADEPAKPHEGVTNRLSTFSSKDMPADAVRDYTDVEWSFDPSAKRNGRARPSVKLPSRLSLSSLIEEPDDPSTRNLR